MYRCKFNPCMIISTHPAGPLVCSVVFVEIIYTLSVIIYQSAKCHLIDIPLKFSYAYDLMVS